MAHSIVKRRKTWLSLNFWGDAQAIGVGLAVFRICPFDIFMWTAWKSQTDTKFESYGRFHQVADSIGKRRKTWLALNFWGHAQAIGVGLAYFWICPFESLFRIPRMSQTDTKCESYDRFLLGYWFYREKKETTTCLKLLRPRASYWSWPCGILDLSFR